MFLDSYETFASGHILTPSLSNASNFVLGDGRLFVTGTAGVTSIVPEEKVDESLLYLLAILNSHLSSSYITTHSPIFSGGYYKFSANYLKSVPIQRIAFTTPADERQRLREKSQKLYERYCQKDDLACVTGFVEHELDEGRSDVVHDLLAFLAEQMIEMNKERQQVTEDFWLDLQGVTDPDTFDTLRNRGKWESSLWKAEACRPFVEEESRSTRHLDDSLGWNEDAFKAFARMLPGTIDNFSGVVKVYREHHPRYHALSERLRQTDFLIDRVVYRLYGLTEEEVGVVEGEGK